MDMTLLIYILIGIFGIYFVLRALKKFLSLFFVITNFIIFFAILVYILPIIFLPTVQIVKDFIFSIFIDINDIYTHGVCESNKLFNFFAKFFDFIATMFNFVSKLGLPINTCHFNNTIFVLLAKLGFIFFLIYRLCLYYKNIISKQDQIGPESVQEHEQLIKRWGNKLIAFTSRLDPSIKHEAIESLNEFNQLLSVAVEKELITEKQAEGMVRLVESGELKPDIELQRLKALIENIKS
jgi:hypothetical protein